MEAAAGAPPGRGIAALEDYGAVLAREDDLPPECRHETWRFFLAITQQICKERRTCMNHPLIKDKAAAALVRAGQAMVSGGDASECTIGIGSAAAFMLRSLTSRRKNIAIVDLEFDTPGKVTVALALSVWDSVLEKRMPLETSFAPFPYDAATLAPFRVRTWHSLAALYSAAARALTALGVPHFAWLGALGFWSELVTALETAARVHLDVAGGAVLEQPGPEHWSRLLHLPPEETTIDVLVPAEMEEVLLGLGPDLEAHGKAHALERLAVHSVERGRLAQVVLTSFPEFGDGVDARKLCPNCAVLNVFFFASRYGQSEDRRVLDITGEHGLCRVLRDDVFPLMRMDDITHFPKAFRGRLGSGLMPARGLQLLSQHWGTYFEKHSGPPCDWSSRSATLADALEADARLGPVSAFVAERFSAADLGVRPGRGGEDGARPGASGSAGPRAAVLASTDFSEQVRGLSDGARGWFEFMELRMSAQRPAMQGFQHKVWMKSLMLERSVPIPRLLFTSEDSPSLPFDGPELPRILEGFCVKPAHLAESHHTFAITYEGMDLLSGQRPTLEEVQGNISEAWGRSLGDYDRTEGIGCAASGVHAAYTAGRSCTNWALYNCPPGLLIEELVKPSPFYEHLSTALLGDVGPISREPPDEVKCHVVWGKVFVAEWVTPKLMLGYIFRHGFVKNTILISPEYQRTCYGGERRDVGTNPAEACLLEQWWKNIVEVAERAVPAGVDYLRVDIFPNGMNPVINELSIGGYATLLEDWMLEEMTRRVKEGYRWRAASGEE